MFGNIVRGAKYHDLFPVYNRKIVSFPYVKTSGFYPLLDHVNFIKISFPRIFIYRKYTYNHVILFKTL